MDSSLPVALCPTRLEPRLLNGVYASRTRWHVITGAPCSGKSTLLNGLAARAYRTVPESARLFIEQQMADGAAAHPIRSDPAALQRGICSLQLKVEAGLPAGELLFLDGAVPGSLAWFRVYGLDPNTILADCFRHRYAAVFVLDRLPFRSDEERVPEMDAIADFLDAWHRRDYLDLGYQVIRVPVLPLEARLEYVLERIVLAGQGETG